MRPDGWENPHILHSGVEGQPNLVVAWECSESKIFESGADALEALWKKMGKVCDPINCKGRDGFSCISCIEYLTQGRKGTLVFIPEEAK
jgi:hypothetical protein